MVQDYSNESKVSSTQLLYNHGGITYIGAMVVQKKSAFGKFRFHVNRSYRSSKVHHIVRSVGLVFNINILRSLLLVK